MFCLTSFFQEALRERGIFRKIRIADGRGNHGYGFIRETSYSDSLKRALVVYSDKDLAKAKKNTKDGKSLETLTYFVNIYISDIMPSFFDLWISREEVGIILNRTVQQKKSFFVLIWS